MGYNESLRKLQLLELKILDEVTRICKKYELTYFLIGGSLLGAVRHGGFIPWDDDIDIALPRKDYALFLKIAEKELDSEYILQSFLNDRYYPRGFAKVRLKNTVFLERGGSLYSEKGQGIFIDVFPMDYAKHERGIQNLQYKIVFKIDAMRMIKCRIVHAGCLKKIIVGCFTNRTLGRIQQWVMSFVKDGNFMVNLISPYSPLKETSRKDFFLPTTELSFEGKKYCVPGNYTAILEKVFGNYMELPPEEKRVAHGPIRLSFDTNGPDEEL